MASDIPSFLSIFGVSVPLLLFSLSFNHWLYYCFPKWWLRKVHPPPVFRSLSCPSPSSQAIMFRRSTSPPSLPPPPSSTSLSPEPQSYLSYRPEIQAWTNYFWRWRRMDRRCIWIRRGLLRCSLFHILLLLPRLLWFRLCRVVADRRGRPRDCLSLSIGLSWRWRRWTVVVGDYRGHDDARWRSTAPWMGPRQWK